MIYIKTLAGQQALKDRALLTPPQRAAFIQFDGKRALGDVLQSCARLGVTGADIDHMVLLGLLEPVSTLADTDTATAVAASGHAETLHTAQERYKNAYPLAAQLTGALGLRGFRLNLAVEGAADLQALKALLPDIAKAVGPLKVKPLEDALSGESGR